MKTHMQRKVTGTIRSLTSALVLTAGLLLTGAVSAQQLYKTSNTELKVLGKSNIHDWEMKSSTFTSEGTFQLNNDGSLQDIKSMDFNLLLSNLKSKESLMDKRAYKALKADKFNKITFKLTSAEVSQTEKAQSVARVTGNLSIAGVTKLVSMSVNCTVNSDKSILVKGSRKMKMSDFEISPPSFMLGALKTGDELTIEFSLTMLSQGPALTNK